MIVNPTSVLLLEKLADREKIHFSYLVDLFSSIEANTVQEAIKAIEIILTGDLSSTELAKMHNIQYCDIMSEEYCEVISNYCVENKIAKLDTIKMIEYYNKNKKWNNQASKIIKNMYFNKLKTIKEVISILNIKNYIKIVEKLCSEKLQYGIDYLYSNNNNMVITKKGFVKIEMLKNMFEYWENNIPRQRNPTMLSPKTEAILYICDKARHDFEYKKLIWKKLFNEKAYQFMINIIDYEQYEIENIIKK